jgi:Rod binding domain-containing protein
MEVPAVSSAAAPSAPQTKKDSPEKILDAAQQFEALLLSQMLRSIRESGKGWLGGDESATSDTATEFAEQQFAMVLAHQGGLGLANLIAKGLQPQQ